MTKTSLLLLALAAGAPLLAQAPGLTMTAGDSSVTLYGILDAGVASVAHTLDFSNDFVAGVNPTLTKLGNTSAVGMMNGGISQTRWGIKGQTELGGGWQAIFNLESAINLQNGAQANSALQYNKAAVGAQVSADTSLLGAQLFNRNANVGVSSKTYGTLTYGLHTSLMLDAIPSFDALGGAQMFTPIGFSGVYGGGGATDNSRVNTSLKYRVKVGDFTLGALYKFGGVSGNSTAKNVSEFMAMWEKGPFAVMFGYQNTIDTTSVSNPSGAINASAFDSAGVPVTSKTTGVVSVETLATYIASLANHTVVYEPIGTVGVTCEDTHAVMLAAKYKVGQLLVTAGYQKLAYTNPSNPTVDAAMTSVAGIPIGLWTSNLSGTAVVAPAVNVAPFTIGGMAMEKDLTVTWVGLKYDFTKKFNAAVSFYNVAQNDFSNGTDTPADFSGHTNYTSVLLDYTFTKAFDMSTKGTGGPVFGYTYDNNTITGLGIRYKF